MDGARKGHLSNNSSYFTWILSQCGERFCYARRAKEQDILRDWGINLGVFAPGLGLLFFFLPVEMRVPTTAVVNDYGRDFSWCGLCGRETKCAVVKSDIEARGRRVMGGRPKSVSFENR